MSLYETLISLSDRELTEKIKGCKSVSEAQRIMGFKRDPRAQKYISDFVQRTGLFVWKNFKKEYNLNDVELAVKSSRCMSDVLRLLGLQIAGGNQSTVKRIIKKHNFDCSHFNVAEARTKNRTKQLSWTVETAFVEHSKVPRSSVSFLVKKFSVLPYKCEGCGNEGSWNGTTLNLTVDHINGIPDDNRVGNLRYLCPNCHSQTSTFGGKRRNSSK